MTKAVLAAIVLILVGAGCRQTGILLELGATSSTVQAGVTEVTFVVAHGTYCERWVASGEDSRLTVDVSGRELRKTPYELLLRPSHFTDFAEPVRVLALARDGKQRLVG